MGKDESSAGSQPTDLSYSESSAEGVIFLSCMCVFDDAGLGQLMMVDCVFWFKGKNESSQGKQSKLFDAFGL
jgi:hypothetical protein